MSFGKMNAFITFYAKRKGTDEEGFYTEQPKKLRTFRAYREDRHGSAAWKNRASYSPATTLFRVRRDPSFPVTHDLFIECGGEKFEIHSIEDVKGRGMYLEILAERMRTDG